MQYGEFRQETLATKVMELFQGKQLNLIFSLRLDDRLSYDRIREALLFNFSYTLEAMRKTFCDSSPEKKQTFLENSSQLQRLFDRWIKQPT